MGSAVLAALARWQPAAPPARTAKSTATRVILQTMIEHSLQALTGHRRTILQAPPAPQMRGTLRRRGLFAASAGGQHLKAGRAVTGSFLRNMASMSLRSGASSGETSDTACPEPPARAVRPIR